MSRKSKNKKNRKHNQKIILILCSLFKLNINSFLHALAAAASFLLLAILVLYFFGGFLSFCRVFDLNYGNLGTSNQYQLQLCF